MTQIILTLKGTPMVGLSNKTIDLPSSYFLQGFEKNQEFGKTAPNT
jgi:hypothetical protein